MVNDNDENARLNPNNGARADAQGNDGDLSPAGRDVSGVAYDRVDTDIATPTTLFGIAASTVELMIATAPNAGTLATVGATGLGVIARNESVNFDISPSARRSSARSASYRPSSAPT